MLKHFKKKFNNILKVRNDNKKFSKYVFFFFISFSFWFLSMLSKKHEVTLDVPVSYFDVPAELVLAENPINKISVRVKAPGFTIVSYNLFGSLGIRLNITTANSKLIKDGKEIFWMMNSKRKKISNILGPSMEILDISPERLSMPFKYKSNKKVIVDFKNKITLKDGFWLSEEIRIFPDSIMIYGDKNQLDTINKVSTYLLELSELAENKELKIGLQSLDGIQYKISDIDIKIIVHPFVEEKIIKRIMINNLEDGYSARLFPDTVAITVRASKEKYHLLKTDFFNVEVDANDMSSRKNTLDLVVKNLPPFIKLQRLYPSRVEYLLIKDY